MSFILHIDTSLETASVCLTKDKEVLQIRFNKEQTGHAAWLHPAIDMMMKSSGIAFSVLQAIAVCNGPGSYTGLRIGMSAAKGFCYALQIPLLTVSSLQMLALAVQNGQTDIIAPLIDARRMEVFTALYDNRLQELSPPRVMILDADSFSDSLKEKKIIFCGDGIKKLKPLISSPNAYYSEKTADASCLAGLAHEKFLLEQFTDLAYSEPMYLKDFYSGKND